jgi:threonine dehydratase
VFVPASTPRIKLDPMRALGADVQLCDTYDEAEQAAKAWARETGAPYISPYGHPHVIAGAGTVALEILDERPDVAEIVVSLGGGGLASGTGVAARSLSGSTQVTAVEVEASAPFTASLARGRIVSIEVGRTLADGLAGNLDPDTPTFALVRQVVDRVLVLPENDLRAAMAGTPEREGVTIEGAAAAAVGAVLSGRAGRQGPTAVVVSGGNVDPEVLRTLG